MIGITSSTVKVIDLTLVCSFIRQNQNSNANYFNLSKENMPYLIVAYGPLNLEGK